MFLNFFFDLKQAQLPVSLKEYLMLMEAMNKRVITSFNVNDFYFLSRSALIKDERHLDKFDNQQGALWIQKTFPPDVLDSAVTEIGGEIDDAIKSSHEETRMTLNLMVQHGVRYVRGKKFKLIYDDYYLHYFCDDSNFSFLYLFSYFKRC